MKSLRLFLEELTPEQKKQVDTWEKATPEARKATDHFFGNRDDVHEELHDSHQHKSEFHNAVERHLKKHLGDDFSINPEDYKNGKATVNGSSLKIGKLLKKTNAPENLKHNFANDTTRQAKKAQGLHVHITRHAYGVAGQTSHGQSWEQQSCKNFENGIMNHHLPHEVKHGTVVSYLKDHKGNELARATLQPYHNDKGKTIYKVDSHYGVRHQGFIDHSHDLAKRLSEPDADKHSSYTIHPSVYNDSGEHNSLHHDIDENDLHHILKHGSDNDKKTALYHPKINDNHLNQALDDKSDSIRNLAILHDKITTKHIDKALNDKNDNVRRNAISHPNANSNNIHKALNDKSENIRFHAAIHDNASDANLYKALDDKNEDIKHAALEHPKIKPVHIHKALDDEDESIRGIAIQHEKANSKNIHKALDDKSPFIRIAALQHPNANKEHFKKALNDEHEDIREFAKSQLKT